MRESWSLLECSSCDIITAVCCLICVCLLPPLLCLLVCLDLFVWSIFPFVSTRSFASSREANQSIYSQRSAQRTVRRKEKGLSKFGGRGGRKTRTDQKTNDTGCTTIVSSVQPTRNPTSGYDRYQVIELTEIRSLEHRTRSSRSNARRIDRNGKRADTFKTHKLTCNTILFTTNDLYTVINT